MSNDAKVVLNQAAIKGIEQKALKCLGLTAKVLQDDIRQVQVVPRDTGNLQGEAFTVDTSREQNGIVSMRFMTPYARRLYFHPEYDFKTDENPFAQGLWLKPWLKGGMYAQRPQEIFTKLLKGSLK